MTAPAAVGLRSALLVVAGLSLAITAAGAQEEAAAYCTRLDRLAESALGAALPPGWSVRAVSGERAPTAAVAEVDGSMALVLRADSAAGQLLLELDRPIPPGEASLEWVWRVDRAPAGAVLERPDLDDAPARVFVVFGGGGLLGRPRVLFYTWGRREDVGHSFISHVSDRVAVIVLRNMDDALGAWHAERRDVFADFRVVFAREPDAVRAIGFMVDTDQTGTSAHSSLRGLWWSDGHGACPALRDSPDPAPHAPSASIPQPRSP